LDKFASGLLLVLVGQAGKLASLFSYCKKEYEGRIRFGIETDTLDPEGKIIREAEIPSRETVEAVLNKFRGEILQSPPAYSAIHIDGVRAHELSRQGKAPEMKERPVSIYELELVSWEPPFACIRVCCSAGTYIRSLARDIALAAGSCAHLAALVRTRIGTFSLSEAFDPGTVSDSETAQAVAGALRPITPEIFAALELPYVYINEEQVKPLIHGQSLTGPVLRDIVNNLTAAPAAGLFDEENRLTAVLEQRNGSWHYGHVFAG
jgi:tRNA pseudouridine55 synthase